MEIDERLSGLFNPESTGRARDESRKRIGATTVNKLLQLLGKGDQVQAVKARNRELTGEYLLTFMAFHDVFAFPMRLEGYKVPYVHETTVPMLFDSFHKSKILDGYRAVKEISKDTEFDGKAGFIFSWTKLKGSYMVIHNGNYGPGVETACFKTIVDHEYVRLEPLVRFAQVHSGNIWEK